jgi:cardiolipin synthase (CMP-forming)
MIRPMTTANKITILRILLIPFFVTEIIYYVRTGNDVHRIVGVLLFAVTAASDGVDGYIARRYNQISELGKILDPLADKLLLVSGIILLSFNNEPYFRQIPLWLTATVIGRDILLAIGSVVIRSVVGNITVHPRIIGKVATVFQMLVIIWILMRWDVVRLYTQNAIRPHSFWSSLFHQYLLQVWTIGAGVLTGVSGLLYVFDGMKQLSAHPSSSPTRKD